MPDVEDSVDEGAGDDGAEAGNGEGAVDGQTGAPQIGTGFGFGEDGVYFLEEGIEAVAGGGG